MKYEKAPEGVIPKAKYDASVYANVVASKYLDHLPLNRLESIYKRAGLHLPKQTMWDMLVTVDELVARPILAQMQRKVLESEVLHSDDTTVRVQVEGQKGGSNGHVWTWRTPAPITKDGEPAKTLVQCTLGRNRAGPRHFLGKWTGTLIVDGLQVYNAVSEENGINRAGCWSHARRGVVTAWKGGCRAAAHLLAPMHRLFWIERAIKQRIQERGLSLEEALALRRKVRDLRSRKVQSVIFERAFNLQEDPAVSPDSTLGKAVNYLINQAEPLQLNLEDARVPIHNNHAEQDLRHVAIGRKNYMTFASEKGGEVAARLYSLVLSAKHAGLDPEAYVRELLSAISTTAEQQIVCKFSLGVHA